MTLEVLPTAQRVNFAQLFGNSRPVELEIGCGKGTFILSRAAARSDLNFLGIEWARSYCEYAADRVRRAGLANVRMACVDATVFVHNHLADESIWRLHVYFPDPWPKRRHFRRRSMTLAFVKELRRILKPGGQLLVVTDHLNYFHQIRRVVLGTSGLASVSFPKVSSVAGELTGTNFERKYIAEGRPVFSLAVLKHQ